MNADAWLDAIQWPAMVVTLLAAWLVASQSERRRAVGFWIFIASNALWIVWGWHTQAWALITLQAGLFALNVRGAAKNERAAKNE
jgi:TctA family transporter